MINDTDDNVINESNAAWDRRLELENADDTNEAHAKGRESGRMSLTPDGGEPNPYLPGTLRDHVWVDGWTMEHNIHHKD